VAVRVDRPPIHRESCPHLSSLRRPFGVGRHHLVQSNQNATSSYKRRTSHSLLYRSPMIRQTLVLPNASISGQPHRHALSPLQTRHHTARDGSRLQCGQELLAPRHVFLLRLTSTIPTVCHKRSSPKSVPLSHLLSSGTRLRFPTLQELIDGFSLK
jgi:hypothetical protein